uniref:Uncharacterized protein n=1 Tax=Panagrolaimus sp. ES5 TaxID=591445 RepID=A0AC34F807_9BILA
MASFNIEIINDLSKNDKEIYAFADANADKDCILLTIYGAQTKKAIAKLGLKKMVFALEFGRVFSNSKLKAFILEIDGIPENIALIKLIRAQIALSGIPYVFFTQGEQMRSSILVASNISLKVGERIVEVLIDKDGYVVSELEYTDKGYIEREQRDCKPYRKMTAEKIRQRILGSNDPVKIICHANSSGEACTKFLTKNVLNNVPTSKLMIMEESLADYEEKFVFETVKWMFDKSYTKFYVCQLAFRNYMIKFKYGDNRYPLMVCKKDEVLPYNKVVTIPKSFLQFSVSFLYRVSLLILCYFKCFANENG